MPKGKNKIIDAGAAEIVSDLLDQKLMLDEIAQRTGFDRNCIWRFKKSHWLSLHARRVKKRLRFDPSRGKIFLQWPYDSKPEGVGEHDVVVKVIFEKTAPRRHTVGVGDGDAHPLQDFWKMLAENNRAEPEPDAE